jgi:hypothetical protein
MSPLMQAIEADLQEILKKLNDGIDNLELRFAKLKDESIEKEPESCNILI